MTRSVQFALLAAAVAIGLIGRPATGFAQMSESDMVVRLDQLEADVRRLTGAVEELQYRNQQLEQALRQMQAGGAPPQAGAPPRPGMAPAGPPPAPGRRSDVFDPTQNPDAPGAPRVLGGGPGGPAVASVGQPAPVAGAAPAGAPDSGAVGAPLDLGSMSGNGGAPAATTGATAPNVGQDVAPPPGRIPGAPGTEVATLPPSQTPRDAFDLAYGYVLHKDYALAAQTFQDFLKKYPSDGLAAEAQFWLGESYFQSKNYQSAAEAFVTMTKKFPSSPKQPDTLLRLGESLAALQQKDLACVTLAEVSKKYPHAAANVKAAIEREQKRVHC
ncbi:MAG TPA: tol-pal system protein YbgF [Xanthobacteraceae bacterium]|nr:tol-pal system protein YbgF [Xanthobacteraceae bacterium]